MSMWSVRLKLLSLFSLPFEKPTTKAKEYQGVQLAFLGIQRSPAVPSLCSVKKPVSVPCFWVFLSTIASFPLCGQKEWPRGCPKAGCSGRAAWAALLCLTAALSNAATPPALCSPFSFSKHVLLPSCTQVPHGMSQLPFYHPWDQITTVNYTWKVGEIKGLPQSCYLCICFARRTAEPNSSFKILIFSLTRYILIKIIILVASQCCTVDNEEHCTSL